MIPYGRQNITQQDIDAVTHVLKSDFLTQGPTVPLFEEAIAAQTQSRYAVALNSATSALHVACLALGVGPGDIVWTSPNSFVASANCALYCGAVVDFVDIEPTTGNICPIALAEKLEKAKANGQLPKVLIPVHFAGQPARMDEVYKLSKSYSFAVIEDASHAIGASYQQEPIGNCRYSDICVFSFHPVKIITSAEGGIATTNNLQLARQMRLLRSHGITVVDEELTEPSHGPWYYQQQHLGFNYRMTDLQAALGLSQLSQLSAFVRCRNELARQYDQLFACVQGVTPLRRTTDCVSSYHLYVVLLNQADQPRQRFIVSQLRALGITAHLHYIPIHLQPYYQQLGFSLGQLPQAENYYQRAITLPMFPGLTTEQQRYIVDAFQRCLSVTLPLTE